jgi:hypothetical protein
VKIYGSLIKVPVYTPGATADKERVAVSSGSDVINLPAFAKQGLSGFLFSGRYFIIKAVPRIRDDFIPDTVSDPGSS